MAWGAPSYIGAMRNGFRARERAPGQVLVGLGRTAVILLSNE